MANSTIINGTLSVAFRNQGDLLFNWGKEMGKDLLNPHSILNVSRSNFKTYIFLLLLKNSFVSFGVSSVLHRDVSALLLTTLTSFILVVSGEVYARHLIVIWTIWPLVLIINSGIIHSKAGRYYISIFVLTIVPLYFSPVISEFITDAFCVFIFIVCIFQIVCEPFGIILQWLAFTQMVIFVLLSVDTLLKAEGRFVDLLMIYVMHTLLIHDAIQNRRDYLFGAILIFTLCYCINETIFWRSDRDPEKYRLDDFFRIFKNNL